MAIFSYIAVNPDGKKVRGTVEASDEHSAKSALEDLHYEVESVSEASRVHNNEVPTSAVTQATPRPSFVFEGKDSANILKKGTIQALNKREAFDRLTHDQKLLLTRLSTVGAPASAFDPELEQWKTLSKVSTASTEPKVVKFTTTTDATLAPQKASASDSALPAAKSQYHPLLSTLRLYAGWLLAWYGLFVALGYYARTRALPWEIPFVSAFSGSSLVFIFVAAIFLFLLFSTLHKALRSSVLVGIFLSIVWILLMLAINALSA